MLIVCFCCQKSVSSSVRDQVAHMRACEVFCPACFGAGCIGSYGGAVRPCFVQAKKSYKAPELRYLGTVADLTRQPAPSMLPPGHPAKPFGM